MKIPVLYRKRLIPAECLLLKDDIVLHRDEKTIVTKWNTIRPKKSLDHGYSCYLLDRGVKVSKFYDRENHLVCWYCDIVSHTYEKATDTYVFTDLLADVLVYPNGTFKVVDLDELADACDQGLLSPHFFLTRCASSTGCSPRSTRVTSFPWADFGGAGIALRKYIDKPKQLALHKGQIPVYLKADKVIHLLQIQGLFL